MERDTSSKIESFKEYRDNHILPYTHDLNYINKPENRIPESEKYNGKSIYIPKPNLKTNK